MLCIPTTLSTCVLDFHGLCICIHSTFCSSVQFSQWPTSLLLLLHVHFTCTNMAFKQLSRKLRKFARKLYRLTLQILLLSMEKLTFLLKLKSRAYIDYIEFWQITCFSKSSNGGWGIKSDHFNSAAARFIWPNFKII